MNLIELKQELSSPNAEKRFSELLNESKEVLSISNEELAELLLESNSSIARWSNGDDLPHPIMRRALLTTIEQYIEL